jgi:hypothetical protein
MSEEEEVVKVKKDKGKSSNISPAEARRRKQEEEDMKAQYAWMVRLIFETLLKVDGDFVFCGG